MCEQQPCVFAASCRTASCRAASYRDMCESTLMNTAIHSISLEQHAQMNGLLLSQNEFSWFQVNVYLLLILLPLRLWVSLVG